MSTGTNASIGPVLSTPMRLAPQPRWNTATTTPKPAATDSRFISAAIVGITRLRNTTVRSRNDSSTTTPMNSGSLLASTCEKSSKIAVWPPTSTWMPESPPARGITVLRSRRSRMVVDSSCGDSFGTTSAIDTPLPTSFGGVVATTPGVPATACVTRANCCWSCVVGVRAARAAAAR